MKSIRLKRFTVFLVITLLFYTCATSRYIVSQDDPQMIPGKLTKKYINRYVVIYFKNGDSKSGVLLAYDDQKLKIFDDDSKIKLDIPFDTIDKIEIKDNKYWLLVFSGILLVGYVLFKILHGIAEGIENMGV